MSQYEAVKQQMLLQVCLTPPASSNAELLLQSMDSDLPVREHAAGLQVPSQALTKASQLTALFQTLSTWPSLQGKN